MDDVSGLTQLGSQSTEYKYAEPSSDMLETFPNKFPGRQYQVDLEFPEFTSLCPKTGQPDFATIRILYVPNGLCIETKSLKLYLFAWRNSGTFMETITNTIRDDLVRVLDPLDLEVTGDFNPRGGIKLIVNAGYAKDVD